MSVPALSGVATPLLGFVLGFALARANSCTVASTRRLVVERRFDWLFGLLIAISWSGVVLLGLSLWSPDRFHLPGALPLGWRLVAGGILVGVGAVINRGCFLGSVALLGRGNLNYLLTFAGMAMAMALSVSPATIDPSVVVPVASPSAATRLVAISGFALIALYSLDMIRNRRRAAIVALIAVGAAGGLIYALNPEWSYLAVIDQAVHRHGEVRPWTAEMGAIAVFFGTTISARLRHQFALVGLVPVLMASCLAGGFLMGVGASLVPGGNDTLMLWSIPGLAPYGIIAYAIMFATIASLLLIGRTQARS